MLIKLTYLLLLTISYFTIRYPLFELHGMKEWSFILFIAGAIIILFSIAAKANKMLPLFTLLGYIFGFIAGLIFQFDYGIGLNSMWIIWTFTYIIAIIIGFLINLLKKNCVK